MWHNAGMDNDRLQATLTELENELGKIEREIAYKIARADGLKQAVNGLRKLVDRGPMPMLDSPDLKNRTVEGRGQDSAPPSGNGKVPGTTEAILTILREAEEPITVEALRAEIDRRGWTNRKSQAPEKLIYETLRRLRLQARVERTERGTYTVPRLVNLL